MIAVPALPGATDSSSTSGSWRSASSNACSRAPDPITRTRTNSNPNACRSGHTLDTAMYGQGMTQSTCPFGRGYDFTDPDVLLKGIPVTEFAELRKTAPVWWNEQTESIFNDGGYWVISRHADIKEISRNSDLWSTNRKGVVMRMPEGTDSEQLELTKALLINHDAPEHTRLRKIVSRLFTPRAVATLEEKLAVAAREIVAAAKEKDSGDFVDDIAMKLPLLAIADLIGVPEADREKLFGWTNSIMNTDDPDFESDYVAANAELMGYAYTMAEERRRCPADDIVTKLVQADVDVPPDRKST